MSAVRRVGGELWMEGVRLSEVASRFGTPCYAYSRAAIESAWQAFDRALAGTEHLVCYAVKANSNLAVLGILARLGSGFDIVSGGELARVLAAGGRADRVIFSGVGKGEDEIRAALMAGIRCFNVESEPELERLDAIARALGVRAPVSLRVNPDVDARTHPYISTGLKGNKFGIAHDRALAAYGLAASLPNLEVTGIDCHIGSQILDMAPLEEALERVLELAAAVAARGIPLRHVDLGGGLGIRYREEEEALDIGRWCATVAARLAGTGYSLVLEPGRAIVGNAGVLLSRVEYLKLDKGKRFAIVDASMSELIRPALYEAWHEISPLATLDRPEAAYDVVGPVCESSDVLGTDRRLAIAPGDGIAILSAGAYGMVMSSNYNSRPRPAEVVIDGDRAVQVRARETIDSLFAGETTLD
ncbi:MAG: diaminopimelate decarboxylase [Betaproteobacteria bacterium]|nr:diaminopimelate decarboxylase [Betaproteobacteria bacterium]PWB63592.1 MAG: diaminopimelate decarboxylase [Betaproteobacteria bacterium]